MYENGCVFFEDISEEEFSLIGKTFSSEMCGWVTYEVFKVRGEDMKQIGNYPGTTFYLRNTKTIDTIPTIDVWPYSEDKVKVCCLYTTPREIVLSPEEAVKFILAL